MPLACFIYELLLNNMGKVTKLLRKRLGIFKKIVGSLGLEKGVFPSI